MDNAAAGLYPLAGMAQSADLFFDAVSNDGYTDNQHTDDKYTDDEYTHDEYTGDEYTDPPPPDRDAVLGSGRDDDADHRSLGEPEPDQHADFRTSSRMVNGMKRGSPPGMGGLCNSKG
jgi:hypothetical protein